MTRQREWPNYAAGLLDTHWGGHARRRAEYERAERMRVIRGKAEYGAYLRTLPGRYNGIPRFAQGPGCPGYGEWLPFQVVDGDSAASDFDPLLFIRDALDRLTQKPRPWYVRLWRWIRRR